MTFAVRQGFGGESDGNEPPCAPPREDWTAGLRGLELQHDVQILLRDWADWSAVAGLVRAAGAELHGLQLTRSQDGFSARCRLKNLSSDAARALADALLRHGVAERASVEHLMLARGGDAR